MGESRYEFRSIWHVNAAPDDVYAVLERLPDYPLWWPQVRTVTALGNDAYELVCRSSLVRPALHHAAGREEPERPGARSEHDG